VSSMISENLILEMGTCQGFMAAGYWWMGKSFILMVFASSGDAELATDFHMRRNWTHQQVSCIHYNYSDPL